MLRIHTTKNNLKIKSFNNFSGQLIFKVDFVSQMTIVIVYILVWLYFNYC